jgi:hypothetical protein
MQSVKKVSLSAIQVGKVPHNDPGTVIAQIIFCDTERAKQMNACLMNNPYHRIVPETAPVIDVTYLELKFIVKLIRRLFLKFGALHTQFLQQFLFARQGYLPEKFPPLRS